MREPRKGQGKILPFRKKTDVGPSVSIKVLEV